MLSSTVRKLMMRWGLLAFVLSWLCYGVFYNAEGRLPLGTPVLLGDSSISKQAAVQWMLPMWLAPFAVSMAVVLLAWMVFDHEAIHKRWGTTPCTKPRQACDGEGYIFCFGLIFGLGGAFFCAAGGLLCLVIGVVTTVMLTLFFGVTTSDNGVSLRNSYSVYVFATTVMWGALSLVLGVGSASIYAACGLVLATALHFAIAGLYYSRPWLYKRLVAPMLRHPSKV